MRTNGPYRTLGRGDRLFSAARAVCGGGLDQAEFDQAGGNGALGAAVGGGDFRDRFVGREGIAELLFLFRGPGGADLRAVGVDWALGGTFGAQGLPARAAG